MTNYLGYEEKKAKVLDSYILLSSPYFLTSFLLSYTKFRVLLMSKFGFRYGDSITNIFYKGHFVSG